MQETWSPRLSELTKKTGHDLPLIKSRLECPLLIALFIRCCLCLKFGPSLETTSCHWHLSLPLQRWFHISFHLSMLINDGWILMQVVRETQWQGSSRKETKIRQTIERCQNTKGKQSMRATRLPSLFLWHQRKIDREKAGRRCACLGMPEKNIEEKRSRKHRKEVKRETQTSKDVESRLGLLVSWFSILLSMRIEKEHSPRLPLFERLPLHSFHSMSCSIRQFPVWVWFPLRLLCVLFSCKDTSRGSESNTTQHKPVVVLVSHQALQGKYTDNKRITNGKGNVKTMTVTEDQMSEESCDLTCF